MNMSLAFWVVPVPLVGPLAPAPLVPVGSPLEPGWLRSRPLGPCVTQAAPRHVTAPSRDREASFHDMDQPSLRRRDAKANARPTSASAPAVPESPLPSVLQAQPLLAWPGNVDDVGGVWPPLGSWTGSPLPPVVGSSPVVEPPGSTG